MAKKPAPGRPTPKPAQQKQVARPAPTSVQGRTPEKQRIPGTGETRQRGGPIKVRAKQMGYFDHIRRRVGDVFTIPADRHPADHKTKPGELIHFSSRWMEVVDPRTPERITTPNQALAQQHDEILEMKYGGKPPQQGIQVGDDSNPDDLPTGTGNPLDSDN